MPYESKPGTRKMGDNPLEKRSCYRMKGFSGFGNSPMTKLTAKQSEHIDTNKDGVISGDDFPLKKRGCACGKMKCNC